MATQLTDREKKKRDEQHVKVLQELLTLPDNQNCADCNERGPRWASTNLGCFLCIRCGGLHRKLGTHISKIKSITLDSWTPEQIEFMKQWGNKKANEKFLAGGAPPAPSHSDQEMEKYVRNKYEKRNFETPGGSSRIASSAQVNDTNTYATQLRALRGMGFEDDSRSISMLKRANGKLDAAIDLLVSQPQAPPAQQQQQSSQSRSNARPSSALTPASRSQPTASSSQQQQSFVSQVAGTQTALAALKAMGFPNDEENLQALNAASGQLENAANRLLDAKNRRENGAAVAVPPRVESANAGSFLLGGPPSSANKGQRGNTRQQQGGTDQQGQNQNQSQLPQQAAANDPFGGFGEDLFSSTPAAQPQQQAAQQQGNNGQFNAPTAASKPAKDSIMSLFNSAPAQSNQMGFGQQSRQMSGFGGGYPQQQMQQGFPGQQQFGGQQQQFGQHQHFNGQQFQQPHQQQFGMQQQFGQQQQQHPQFGGQQQFGGGFGSSNPFGNAQQPQQFQQQQQQPSQQYTYGSRQANVSGSRPLMKSTAALTNHLFAPVAV
ncbi:hypothetical protein HKX48_003498 [Thoreauomyces humboldtii]|nr:hypothetical protein HKX48_003498 [Thoreauomyces humboldtii]